MSEEEVFKALADPSRRKLLDLLFQRDGQSLSELHAHLPMTRFGCMQHLRVLENAGLISTRKVGREKLHYLNPVPIQLVYDRWVSKYAQPWATALTHLKYELEGTSMSQKHSHVFEVYIRTTPERLWQALTDGAITSQYYFGTRVESAWTPGAGYRYLRTDGEPLLDGEVVEIDPPHRLVQTFHPLWRPELLEDQPSRVTWVIEPMGAVCKLTLTHDELDPTHPLTAGLISGWQQILSGLKTLLETGEPLGLQP
jgi:uncharacterized protein YndB with AHSA1/START domain